MKATTIILAVLLVLALAIGAIAVYAQVGGGYNLTWNTIDGGGVSYASGGATRWAARPASPTRRPGRAGATR